MNDPIMDELNEAVPRLTEEALKSMDEFQKESQYRQQVLQEAAGGDQGQTEQTNQTQSQTSSTELKEVEPNLVEGLALSRKDN